MIHHVSIPARDPQHVGEVLAELMRGERATLDIPPNGDQVVFGDNAAPPHTWPFHIFLSVPREPDEIERIGAREGWHSKTYGRGMLGYKPFFRVIEFWLENRLMIEVVSPAMAREYQDFVKNAGTTMRSDPEALRLMRATHIVPQEAH